MPHLHMLGGHNLLFSEHDQAVYELDPLSAHVWRSLNEGRATGAIIQEIIEKGGSGDAVQERLVTLSPYRNRGALPEAEARSRVSRPRTPLDTADQPALTLDVAGTALGLFLPPELLEDVRGPFGHLVSLAPCADIQIRAQWVGEDIEFLDPPDAQPCRRAEFLPALKMHMIAGILRSAPYELALHAGALVRDDRVQLLVGSPGAGKTTLGIALSQAGWALDADDVVLMHGDGQVTGITFPFAAKRGTWPLIARYFPDGLPTPVHRRPDGQLVRFIRPQRLAAPLRRPVGAVILLDRSSTGGTRIEDVDPTAALAALIAEGDTRDHRLSANGFSALVGALADARCVKLSYSDFADASDALQRLW